MASSIPSMSTANNFPLSLPSSTSLSLCNFNQDESHRLNSTTTITKNLTKIKKCHFEQDQSNPINFSSSKSNRSAANANLGPISCDGSSRKEKRLRKSTSSVRSGRRNSTDRFLSRRAVDLDDENISLLYTEPRVQAERSHEGEQGEEVSATIQDFGSSYHLKWDDHINSTVSAIQLLLQNETFVDVTLVCDGEYDNDSDHGESSDSNSKEAETNNNILVARSDDEDDADADDDFNKKRKIQKSSENENEIRKKCYSTKFKAHKVIISTCSEYFCRIFSENPCKHPVIVLKDFEPWEVRALLDFMYKGQVIVKPERLETLVKLADSLQIRGLKECIEKSPEWKQRKVTSSSLNHHNNNNSEKTKNQEEAENRAGMMMELNDESTTSKYPTRHLNNPSKYTTNKSNKLRNHEMKNILMRCDDDDMMREDDLEDAVHDGAEYDDENGPSSPKLLNLSMSGGDMLDSSAAFPLNNHRHYNKSLHHQQQQQHEQPLPTSFNNRRTRRHNNNNHHQETTLVTAINEPQTTDELAAGDFSHIQNNNHGQINPSASSPPFPRRKQARPRRRSGDFVAQDLRTIPSGYNPFLNLVPSHDDIIALQQQQQQQQQNNNEILDFTIGNNNNNVNSKRNVNERLPAISQVNTFIANHFLKTWSSSTSGTSRIDSPPAVQSPQHLHPHHLGSSLPLKRELDPEELLSPVMSTHDNYHSSPGTPDSSPTFTERHNKPPLPRRRDRLSRRHHSTHRLHHHPFNEHESLLLPSFSNSTSPPSNYFLNLNNGHHPPPPLHHRHHHLSGHHSDPESLGNLDIPITQSTPPPKSFSPIGFPLSLSTGSGNNGNVGGSPGQQWPGLPLGPPPIFGRHRAQHSAPRGGPPRAWSNADLTEALHNVWNKKMTTSQASRIFGIPYNSLLMYVRGKYGKSLKLDLLKKGLDLAMLEKANKNNSSGTSTSNRSSTPSNTNNTNNNGNKSKSHSATADSPPLSLNLNSLMGGDREQNINSSTNSNLNNNHNRNDPQDIIPSGFNPFSIFGEYPAPFPFSNAAAAAALSHILPPPPPSHSAANHHLGMGVGGEKVSSRSHTSSHHRSSSSDIDK